MRQFSACSLAALGLLLLLPVPAVAQGRPDVRNMTCAEARSLVWQRGAAVLTTGQHTYDRYVANERFCAPGYMRQRAFVQTRDAQSCPIGYTCVLDTEREDRWWWLRKRD